MQKFESAKENNIGKLYIMKGSCPDVRNVNEKIQTPFAVCGSGIFISGHCALVARSGHVKNMP